MEYSCVYFCMYDSMSLILQVLKFYAWEVPFGETAKKERTKELKLLRTAYIAQGVSVALSMTAPYVVSRISS